MKELGNYEKFEYYEELLKKMIYNTIVNISEIVNICNYNLGDFTKKNGYSISAVSRLRNKVKKDSDSVMSNLPYAVSMLNGLDSIYLFENLLKEQQNKINNLIFKNMMEDVIVFIDPDGKYIYSREIRNQIWYKINHKNNIGFQYQMQYFMHEIEKGRKLSQNRADENQFLKLIKTAKVAFTVPGYNEYYDELNKIYESLNKTYFEKKGFRIFVSSLIKKNNFYLQNKFEFPKYVDMRGMKYKTNENIRILPEYEKDIVIILENLFYSEKKCETENRLLLFISDEDEIKRLKETKLEKFAEVIFAYKKYMFKEKKLEFVFNFKNKILKFKYTDSVSVRERLLKGGV